MPTVVHMTTTGPSAVGTMAYERTSSPITTEWQLRERLARPYDPGVATERIVIRDVGPRDGLQNERPVEPAARAMLAEALAAAGLPEVEVAAFVSPTAVPAMAGAAEVVAAVDTGRSASGCAWWALVPNARGAQLATAAGVERLSVTLSASEGYSAKNVRATVSEAIASLAAIGAAAPGAHLDVVVSCAFGSPFDDVPDAGAVVAVVAKVLDALPRARITLADTTGTATPRRIRAVVDRLAAAPREQLGLHLHDTRGTALANALCAIECGVRRFDTSVGGLGGSPFAPGAGGNLATEDLVLVLHDDGFETGIDFDALLRITGAVAELVGHPVASRTAAAGPISTFGS